MSYFFSGPQADARIDHRLNQAKLANISPYEQRPGNISMRPDQPTQLLVPVQQRSDNLRFHQTSSPDGSKSLSRIKNEQNNSAAHGSEDFYQNSFHSINDAFANDDRIDSGAYDLSFSKNIQQQRQGTSVFGLAQQYMSRDEQD